MEPIRAIRLIGFSLIVFSFLAIFAFIDPFFTDTESFLYVLGPHRDLGPHFYFWAGSVAFYLLLGLGVLLRTRWGYFVLKGFLYILLLAFPIGTWISYKMLSYMKRHEIKKYFGARVLLL